jgi:MYXO-CTERM domain-containing protein
VNNTPPGTTPPDTTPPNNIPNTPGGGNPVPAPPAILLGLVAVGALAGRRVIARRNAAKV